MLHSIFAHTGNSQS